LLNDFILKKMDDYTFAKFLRTLDPKWTYNRINSEYTQFLCKGVVVAMCKYKNSTPLSKSTFIHKNYINN